MTDHVFSNVKINQFHGLRFKYGLCPYDGTHAIKHAVFEKNFRSSHDVILCFVGYILYFFPVFYV